MTLVYLECFYEFMTFLFVDVVSVDASKRRSAACATARSLSCWTSRRAYDVAQSVRLRPGAPKCSPSHFVYVHELYRPFFSFTSPVSQVFVTWAQCLKMEKSVSRGKSEYAGDLRTLFTAVSETMQLRMWPHNSCLLMTVVHIMFHALLCSGHKFRRSASFQKCFFFTDTAVILLYLILCSYFVKICIACSLTKLN